MGLLGVDKGAGVKLAILPPGYDGPVPEGITPLQSDTYGGFALIRSNLASHAPEDVAKSVAYGKRVKVYPLAQAENPPETVFVDAQDVLFDSTIRYDATFFEHLDRIVQEEPWLDRDRAMIDPLATVGIVKGTARSARRRDTRHARRRGVEAKAYLDARYERGWGSFFEGTALARRGTARPRPRGRGRLHGARRLSDRPARGGLHYRLRRHQAARHRPVLPDWAIADSGRRAARRRRHLPPDRAARRAGRAVLVGDGLRPRDACAGRATWTAPAAPRTRARCRQNPDGSIDIYFGPKPPAGQETNWVPTDPGRGFEVMFRLYGPKEALFDKTWTLPDLEKVAPQ